MFWADKIAETIKSTQHIDDMFTPSGYAHVGSLRGPVLHDVVYRVFLSKNKNTVFTYIFNDFDPIDGLPPEYQKSMVQYMGYPLRLAPPPQGQKRSFADYFADDFKDVLNSLGVNAKYLSSWDMYHEGLFDEAIKTALDNVEKIQNIYHKVSGSKKKDGGWYPLQVICPKCSKLGTTKVTDWDGKEVTFTCEENLVVWAKGCGYKGKVSPFSGNAKLPWKVDWPAHWKVLGVTYEGAGKDHASRGGSYDIAFELCKEVFDTPKPFYFPYEFFLFGGKKMGSSKGIGLKARDMTTIMPSEIARFMIVRVIPNKALEFDPNGDTIPNIFDEFDRCANAYWTKSDPDLSRIFELSMVNDNYNNEIFLPRFKDVANYIQLPNIDIYDQYQKIKKDKLNAKEMQILDQRINYAKIWLKFYALEKDKFSVKKDIPEKVKELSLLQKNYLKEIIRIIKGSEDGEKLQEALYEKSKEIGIGGKDAFRSIYISLIGKEFGPKAAWFILSLDRNFVEERFREVSKLS